jgi:hypothetical protein
MNLDLWDRYAIRLDENFIEVTNFIEITNERNDLQIGNLIAVGAKELRERSKQQLAALDQPQGS